MFKHIIDDQLDLRLLQPYNDQELFALIDANRDHLKEWLPWLDYNVKVEDSLGFIERSLKEYAEGLCINCGIWYEDKLVGLISLMSIDKGNRKAEIGYWLGQEAESKGLMTKANSALIDYAFGPLNLNRITIRCATGNNKSRAIPKRLGFTKEGCMKESEWLYDHFVDHVIYGMTASQWKKN